MNQDRWEISDITHTERAVYPEQDHKVKALGQVSLRVSSAMAVTMYGILNKLLSLGLNLLNCIQLMNLL